MAIYNGTIVNKYLIKTQRRNNKDGCVLFLGNVIGGSINRVNNGVIARQGEIISGSVTRIRSGIDLRNFKFIKFGRIPKERILNKFSLLGGNIKY